MPQAQITTEQFKKLHGHYLEHPAEFVSDILCATPWTKQVEIIDAVFKYSTVAVKTCNSVGKSYIAARIAITYLMLYQNSIVVTTAPTWNQVTNVLWREIRSAVKQAERVTGIKLTDNEVNQAGLNIDTKWYAIGVSTSTPDNMMGFHADHLLVIVDEAGGVDDLMFNGVRAITTNVNNKILLIGNPTTPDGEFHRAFGDSSRAKQYTISAFDTPNFTANGINTVDDLLEIFTPPPGTTLDQQIDHYEATKRAMKLPYPELIHPGDVYLKYIDWGPDSAAWQSLVLGEFPSQADQALFPANLVIEAMNMYGESDYTTKDPVTGKEVTTKIPNYKLSGWNIPDGPRRYGQDMARFGMDLNVMSPRHGGWCEQQIIWNKKGQGKLDLMESADMILNVIDPLDDDTFVSIDDSGNGGGTTDRLRQISREEMASGRPAHRYKLIDFNFGKGPNNPDKFHDITSELYWNLRTQFMNKAVALVYDEKLKNELLGRRWEITPQKKIKVESKQEYKDRTKGKSPDRSDSLALAFYDSIAGVWSDDGQRSVQHRVVKKQDGPVIVGASSQSYEEAAAMSVPVTGGMGDTRY